MEMDRAAVVRRLHDEERRIAIGWVGARGEADPANALRELLLREQSAPHATIEVKVKMAEPQMRDLFVALCRRCGLEPYREPKQRKSTVMLKAPEKFVHDILWPLFNGCADIVRRESHAWFTDVLSGLRQDADPRPRD